MLSENLLAGSRVRLTALLPDDLPAMSQWYEDAGFMRLYDARPAYPQTVEGLKQQVEEGRKRNDAFYFAVRPLAGGELLGYVEIDGILWTHGVTWLGIGFGNRAHWGKGYGKEAMQLALGFAYRELNMHRVQLTVFSYNERAIALYEKLGFRREGVFREFLHRDGQRYDMYLYGLLREEWEAR